MLSSWRFYFRRQPRPDAFFCGAGRNTIIITPLPATCARITSHLVTALHLTERELMRHKSRCRAPVSHNRPNRQQTTRESSRSSKHHFIPHHAPRPYRRQPFRRRRPASPASLLLISPRSTLLSRSWRRSWGISGIRNSTEAARQRILIPPRGGSNPPTPPIPNGVWGRPAAPSSTATRN